MRAIVGQSDFRRSIARRLLRSCALFLVLSAMSCPQGEDILFASGYTSLVPASNLFTPGAVIAMESDGEGGLDTAKIKLTCGPRASLGPSWQPISSQAATQTLRKKKNSSWHADTKLLGRVNAGLKGSEVSDIEITLKNVRLMQIEDADVLANLKFRSEECRKAIEMRLQLGYVVSMVSSALVADMSYKVTFKKNEHVTQQMKIREMQQIASSLGGGVTRVSLKEIESKGLALGIKTDAFLLALSTSDSNDLSEKIVANSSSQRVIDMREAEADMTPDAPLVLPLGGYAAPTAEIDD